MSFRKSNILHLLLALGFWLMATCAYSQNIFSSEEDLKKQANKYFEEEEFGKAYPLFSQLLSLYPKDPQYNFKFGTCLLFSSNDKGKAIPYIEYAAKRQKQDVDKEVFFYLGKAYHLNYRFADAIKSYNTFKTLASSRQLEKYEVLRQIEMCESGKKLLKSVSELSVLEKKEVPVSDFFRSYNLSEFNAKLILKPEDLKSSVDKKKKDESLMYLSPDRNQIYYTSYGEDEKNGKDIYYVTRTSSGDLSKPTRVSDAINTKYDEDYAFLHPNGKTLYFCSKGHNSMGGYDIFKSEWDFSSKSWGKPVNMDFAINTPDDDILFISDAEDKSAYFSSKRESAEGRINVYKIKLERKPLDLAIITGTLTKTVGDRMAKATITVTKILKDEVVGVFNTNAADGSYTLKLPNGGKFMLAVESAGFKKSSELIVVPNQQEIKPLKQEITLVNENGQDKILLKNDFDAQVDSADMQLAIEYIKAKASLEISSAEEEIAAVAVEENVPAQKADDKINNAAGQKPVPVTNTDIIEMAYQDAKVTQKDANEMLKNSEAARLLSRQKNELSIQKYNEALELMRTAETITNPEEKLTISNRAAATRKESEMLSKESAMSLNLSNQMETQAEAKQKQADAELKYAKDLDNAIKTNASESKMNELLARKEDLDKNSEVLNVPFPPDMSKQIAESQEQATKSMAKYLDIQKDVEDLQSEAKRLHAEAEKTTNAGVKENLNQQATEMEKEAEGKKKEAEVFSAEAKQKQQQADSLKTSAFLTTSVMKQIQGSSESTTASATPDKSPKSTAITATAVPESPATPVSTQPAEAVPATLQTPYVDVFVNQTREAESKTNPLEKEQALAVIYQSWTDSLDKQISSLNRQLGSTTNEEQKTKVQNKIYELQSSVEEKRQKAADSRNKVDNLKLQQALAEASTVTPAATNTVTAAETATTPSSAVIPETVTGIKNINAFYENKLKENTQVTNEYEKKSKEQELYQNWSASLFDESQRLRNEGNSGKADNALNESKEKQAIAIRTADEVTKIKTEKPELVAAANVSPAQTTPSTAPVEIKTTPAVVPVSSTPETTPVPTNTVAPAVSTPVETTPATISSTTQPASITTPVSTTAVTSPGKQSTTVAPETITHKDEYTHFTSLQNESEWSKKNAERQYQQSAELQKKADDQFRESQKLSEKSATMNDPNIQKVLQQQADELDRNALRNQAKADSVKSIAKNSEAESNAKRTESDLYLQSIDKAAYEEITATTGYKPGQETVALNTAPTKTEVVPAKVETVSKEPDAAITPTPVTATPVKTETVIPEPVKTEPAKEINVIAAEPVVTKPETVIPPVKTETAIVKTETKPTAAPEVTQPVKEEPVSPPTKTETAISIKTEPAVPPSTSSSTFTSSAEMLKYYDALFDKLELGGADYSSSKPIPVDAPMPEGLVFKVQIGAFRNPIPQSLFKGIKPITAETTPQGLKRYTAGLFQKFSTANNAKNQVNGLGYRDAFVVAFFNGKRISMNDAMAKARENGETIDPAAMSSSTGGQQQNTTSTSTSGSGIANATDVSSVSGIFYTVQIGVFSREVNSTQLYDISPLNSERTENGLIRYTTGRFDDETKAVRAKNSITEKGIKDAFVIAYQNGKRISLSVAKSTIESQGREVLAKDKQEYTFVPSDTTTSESSGIALTTASNLGIVFKVQVGAFKEQVPIAIANRLLANSSRGIKTFRDDNGLLVYTIGEFLEYESANNLKAQLVGNGLKDAFVIAFKDGKKITATAALEMIRNR